MVPLPKHFLDTLPTNLTQIDPAPFLPDPQEDLVQNSSNLVPIPSTYHTDGLSTTALDMQKPIKPSNKKETCARTHHRQPQQKLNRTFLHPDPIKVRAKRNLKVCPNKKKAPALLTKTTQTWTSKNTQATQTYIDTESSFYNDNYAKIHAILKKLDTSNPLHVTAQNQILHIIQQRQGLLQSMNLIIANVNIKEATTTFAMFNRSPFTPWPPNYGHVPSNLLTTACKSSSESINTTIVNLGCMTMTNSKIQCRFLIFTTCIPIQKSSKAITHYCLCWSFYSPILMISVLPIKRGL